MKKSPTHTHRHIQTIAWTSALLLAAVLTVAGCSSTPTTDTGIGTSSPESTPSGHESATATPSQDALVSTPGPSAATADFEADCQTKIGADAHATGTVTIDHKAWGKITIVSCGPTDVVPSSAEGVLAVDSSGIVTWNSGVPADVSSQQFSLAHPATDASGNVFITYNPGRYEGVMILHPSDTGIDILAGSYYENHDPAATSSYPNDFYDSQLIGPGSDGLYQIAKSVNNCDPDCASGQTTTQVYTWDRQSYVTK